jgi:hypothetical protein
MKPFLGNLQFKPYREVGWEYQPAVSLNLWVGGGGVVGTGWCKPACSLQSIYLMTIPENLWVNVINNNINTTSEGELTSSTGSYTCSDVRDFSPPELNLSPPDIFLTFFPSSFTGTESVKKYLYVNGFQINSFFFKLGL